ncbi:hypothetical protein HDU97_010358 [Phlyctochytrium planicorne]|nr:hypothetical protein HDU97_010358 [Phlyctochytrium planicorne]
MLLLLLLVAAVNAQTLPYTSLAIRSNDMFMTDAASGIYHKTLSDDRWTKLPGRSSLIAAFGKDVLAMANEDDMRSLSIVLFPLQGDWHGGWGISKNIIRFAANLDDTALWMINSDNKIIHIDRQVAVVPDGDTIVYDIAIHSRVYTIEKENRICSRNLKDGNDKMCLPASVNLQRIAATESFLYALTSGGELHAMKLPLTLSSKFYYTGFSAPDVTFLGAPIDNGGNVLPFIIRDKGLTIDTNFCNNPSVSCFGPPAPSPAVGPSPTPQDSTPETPKSTNEPNAISSSRGVTTTSGQEQATAVPALESTKPTNNPNASPRSSEQAAVTVTLAPAQASDAPSPSSSSISAIGIGGGVAGMVLMAVILMAIYVKRGRKSSKVKKDAIPSHVSQYDDDRFKADAENAGSAQHSFYPIVQSPSVFDVARSHAGEQAVIVYPSTPSADIKVPIQAPSPLWAQTPDGDQASDAKVQSGANGMESSYRDLDRTPKPKKV